MGPEGGTEREGEEMRRKGEELIGTVGKGKRKEGGREM